MRGTFAALVVGAGLLMAVAPLLAHHSFSAEFDNSKPLTLKGNVTRMDWVNPHSWVHFDVAAADGKVVNWGAETPPTNVLFRNGWKKDSLKIGDEIQIQGFGAKDGSPNMWASSVILVSTGQRILQMMPPAVVKP
jgi:uncharacterized protein DUF6152